MRSSLKRYQLVIFFALTFIITWAPWVTTGSGWYVWGPSLAGLIMTAIVGGKEGIRDLLRRAVRWRVGIVWYAVVLLVPIVVAFASNGIQYVLGGPVPTFTFIKEQWYLLPPLFLLVMFFPTQGPVAEEFGWRGYALPQLQEKWGPVIASLIIGTAWGVWHLPEFFAPGTSQYAMGIGLLVPFTISEIANSIFMTWVYNKTRGSLLIAGLMAHAATNFLGVLLITEVTVQAFTRGAVVLLDSRLVLLFFGIMTLVALILVIATRGRLGYSAKDETAK